MSEKKIEFDDGSIVTFIIIDGSLHLTIQGRHMEEEKIKFTSATITLNLKETVNLIDWIRKEINEHSEIL